MGFKFKKVGGICGGLGRSYPQSYPQPENIPGVVDNFIHRVIHRAVDKVFHRFSTTVIHKFVDNFIHRIIHRVVRHDLLTGISDFPYIFNVFNLQCFSLLIMVNLQCSFSAEVVYYSCPMEDGHMMDLEN